MIEKERLELALHSWCYIHTLTAKHKQSRAAIPNPIVVNMKPASFRQWGEFGPHIPIRPISKAILHNAAQRTAAEQDFDFPQCDSNFIFLWKETWLLRLESWDEQWRAFHKTLVWPFTYNSSNKYTNMLWLVWCGGIGRLVRLCEKQQPLINPQAIQGDLFYWARSIPH